MWGYMGHEGWGGMGFGMLLFWGLLIVVLVMLAKSFMKTECTSGKQKDVESALDILKQRYARGEIEKDEFEQKKRDLES